jgi:hypothetical protein
MNPLVTAFLVIEIETLLMGYLFIISLIYNLLGSSKIIYNFIELEYIENYYYKLQHVVRTQARKLY